MQMIGRVLARCELVLLWLSLLAAFAMMLLTAADAMGRYLFNAPIIGAYEVTEKYLMVALIFFGLAHAFRGGVFIRVTFFINLLPRSLRLAADYLAHAVTVLYCAIILHATGEAALRALQDHTELATVPIPAGPAYVIVPVGFLALTIAILIDVTRISSGASQLLRDEGPAA